MKISTHLSLLAKRSSQLKAISSRMKKLLDYGLGNNSRLHTLRNKLLYSEIMVGESLAFHLTSLVAEYKAMVWGVK